MDKQRYAIIGTGALGGLYGGMLARAGHEVHFLVRSDYRHLRQHGLRVESPWGDFHLPSPQVHDRAETLPRCDVTIVALKTTCNDRLSELLPAPTGDDGVVLVLQNGLDIESDSAAVVGDDRVLGGCCFLCSNKVGPGHIRHLDYGRIAFGEYSDQRREITPRMQHIHQDLTSAGIDAEISDNLPLVRWRKLMWNIPFNGLSVVLNATTKQLIDDQHTVALVESIITEVHTAAGCRGVEIPEKMIRKTIEVTRSMVPYDSSMRLDFLNRRPMEVEAIFGNPLRVATQVGASMPRVEMLYQQLKFIDRNNQ